MLQRIERRLPAWFWAPQDHWARWKGYGRIFLFVGAVCYGVGLLGMRMTAEQRRKQDREHKHDQEGRCVQ